MFQRHLNRLQLRLHEGAARRQQAEHGVRDHDALPGPDQALHQLALSPKSAGQAMALLQAFQCHQVGLDAQIESARQALADAGLALLRQTRLHDRLPVACLRIDQAGHLLACNRTAREWLGLEAPALRGLLLSHFLSPADHAELQQRMVRINQGRSPAPLTLGLLTPDRAMRPTQAAISADDQPDHYIVVLMDRAPL